MLAACLPACLPVCRSPDTSEPFGAGGSPSFLDQLGESKNKTFLKSPTLGLEHSAEKIWFSTKQLNKVVGSPSLERQQRKMRE